MNEEEACSEAIMRSVETMRREKEIQQSLFGKDKTIHTRNGVVLDLKTQPFKVTPKSRTQEKEKRRGEITDEEREGERVGEVKEGVGSIALLPRGSISGHFFQTPLSICYGLHGTELACETECSRGEDYRLIKLTIIDYNSKKEQTVVVQCKGHDAARINNVEHAHGWEEDVIGLVEQKHGKKKVSVSFECETLKADKAAEDHIRQFMPKLAGLDAVINIGPMKISGLDFAAVEDEHTN